MVKILGPLILSHNKRYFYTVSKITNTHLRSTTKHCNISNITCHNHLQLWSGKTYFIAFTTHIPPKPMTRGVKIRAIQSYYMKPQLPQIPLPLWCHHFVCHYHGEYIYR